MGEDRERADASILHQRPVRGEPRRETIPISRRFVCSSLPLLALRVKKTGACPNQSAQLMEEGNVPGSWGSIIELGIVSGRLASVSFQRGRAAVSGVPSLL